MKIKLRFGFVTLLLLSAFLLSLTFSSKTQVTEEHSLFTKIDKKKYEELISLFDERWKKFYKDSNNRFDNGFYLSPHEEIPFQAIKKSDYFNLPKDAAYIVEEFRGYIVAVSFDRKQIYVSKEKNFSSHSTVKLKEEIPDIKNYYLEEITTQSLKLLWGHLKPNYNICRSFLEMYRITKNRKYLEPARKILVYLINQVGEDGLYRLPFPNLPLTYRAMYQSNLLQLFYDYYLLSPEKDELNYSALLKIAQAFYFTDEGTRDHWLEATIGEVILDLLNIKEIDVKKLIKDLNLLYGYIDQYDGKIPFCTTPCDPPRFTPNYQNYNVMLLAVLSSKYVQKDLGLKNVFPHIFEIAKKSGNMRLFRGLYYAKLQFDFDDPNWANDREKYIMESDSFYEIPILLKYKILSNQKN